MGPRDHIRMNLLRQHLLTQVFTCWSKEVHAMWRTASDDSGWPWLGGFLTRIYLYVSGDFHVMVESGSKIMAASLLPELVRQKDTSALPTCLHDLPKAHMANLLSHEIPEILHVVGQSCLLARLARGAPACVSQACALKTTSLVFLLYVATPDHPQSTHAQQRKVCSFCAIHSWQPLFQHAHVLSRGPSLAVSQGIVYDIVLVHHAPLVSISRLWPFLLLSCWPVNVAIKKDKHEMLGKLLSCTCWDLKKYKPLAEIYKPLHGCCWLLQRLWAHREKQQHRRHTTQHTMSLVAIWRHHVAIWENMAALWFETETRCEMNHLPGYHDHLCLGVLSHFKRSGWHTVHQAWSGARSPFGK